MTNMYGKTFTRREEITVYVNADGIDEASDKISSLIDWNKCESSTATFRVPPNATVRARESPTVNFISAGSNSLYRRKCVHVGCNMKQEVPEGGLFSKYQHICSRDDGEYLVTWPERS